MRRARVPLLLIAVGLVLSDSAIVTLALPDILRDLGSDVAGVAWVLIAFNLVLALAAVPAARLCLHRDPAQVCVAGIVVFAASSAVCAVAPSMSVLIGARAVQAVGGALVIVSCLELLVVAAGAEKRGVTLWVSAGVVGLGTGPVLGGLLTSAFSWQSIFVVQVPLVLVAVTPALSLRQRDFVRHGPARDRPDVLANLALALLSAALTAAIFLLVLLLVEGWRRSPATAAVAVTVVPAAALLSSWLGHLLGAPGRAEIVGGCVMLAGGLAALAYLPAAKIPWTIAPQALIGLGLGLTVDSLTTNALRDRIPRALHGGWTIAARHAGVVVGLAILTPVFTGDIRAAQPPAEEAIASVVLDAPLSARPRSLLLTAWGVSSTRRAVASRTCIRPSPRSTCAPMSWSPRPKSSATSMIRSSVPPLARSTTLSSSPPASPS